MFRWKASTQIEYLLVFAACGRLIYALPYCHLIVRELRTQLHMCTHQHTYKTQKQKSSAIQEQYSRSQLYMKQFMSLTGFNLAR